MLASWIITGMGITSPFSRIRPRPPTGSDAPAANSALSGNTLAARSGRPRDVLCFHALPALDRLRGHSGAVLKVLEPVARYILVPHEDVLAFAVRSDKAVAEVGAIPLDPSLCHDKACLSRISGQGTPRESSGSSYPEDFQSDLLCAFCT